MKLAAKFTPKPVGGLVRGASEFNCSTLNTNTNTEQIKIKSLKKNMMMTQLFLSLYRSKTQMPISKRLERVTN